LSLKISVSVFFVAVDEVFNLKHFALLALAISFAAAT